MAGSTHEHSAGNGSLMRLSPIAIRGVRVGIDQMREEARVQSAITHGAPACLDACEAWAVMLRAVITGGELDDALRLATELNHGDPIQPILAGSWRDKTRDQISSSGYVAHSLEAALWCNARGSDFREVILLAANLGDDADTVAAIAGQLAGARFGVEAIPADWRAKVAWHDRLIRAADALLEGPA
jgi:ADP-ribosyl-[dinitrogen reductase] hydrolase